MTSAQMSTLLENLSIELVVTAPTEARRRTVLSKLQHIADLLRRVSPDARALREVIVLTINGIAAGLKNTG
jgi:phosphoenolpyruvate carboxylase